MRTSLDNFGGHTGGETPLPISNREVKPARADGTRRATSRESRSPPISLLVKGRREAALSSSDGQRQALEVARVERQEVEPVLGHRGRVGVPEAAEAAGV